MPVSVNRVGPGEFSSSDSGINVINDPTRSPGSPMTSGANTGQLDGLPKQPESHSQRPPLVRLPREIQLEIAERLPIDDLKTLSLTCRNLLVGFIGTVKSRQKTVQECIDEAREIKNLLVKDRQRAVNQLLSKIKTLPNVDRPPVLALLVLRFETVPRGAAREASALTLFSMVMEAPFDKEHTVQAVRGLRIMWLPEKERAAHIDAYLGLCLQLGL